MRFKLEIQLGNDAMKTRRHIREALQSVRAQLVTRGPPAGIIRDVNGSSVGAWTFLPNSKSEGANVPLDD